MKINKITVLLLTIWFAMMLIGCNTTGISNETGETNKESEEKILTQAPNVTISNSEEAVVLPFGPGEWEYNLKIVCQIFAKWKRESYAGNSSYCIMLTAE